MWIFGYGSLIWNADFEYEEKCVGYIRGYVRRFWQASTDHRGVPGAPGRVVTLMPYSEYTEKYPDEHLSEEKGIVWGMAYRVHSDNIDEVREYLDYREKNGYSIQHVTVYCHSGEQLKDSLVYIGTSDNTEFIGPSSLEQMALQIKQSVGPSGPNIEYFHNLVYALKEFPVPEAVDPHLKSLQSVIDDSNNGAAVVLSK